MRPLDSIPIPRWPAVAILWALLLAGHAAVGWAPLPARHVRPALALALGAGALSFAVGACAARRTAGIRRVGLARLEAACGVAAVLAAGAARGAESDCAAWPLPVHPRPARVRIEGKVADATTVDATPASLLIEARRVAVGASEADCRARIVARWRDEAAAPKWAVPGLWLSLEGSLRPPEDARVAGVEAPGRWMERLGIDGSLDVDPHSVFAPSDPPDRIADPAALARDRLARLFSHSFAAPVAALARGVLLGDRSGIEPRIRDAFRDGGTIHILSISGLHVCILGGFAAVAATAFRLASGAGLAIELLAVWGYTLLVGAPASALRAAILWTAVRSGRVLGRETRPLAAWGLAGLLLHLADPRAPHDPGFQLSFGAVLGLLAMGSFASEGLPDRAGRKLAWLRSGVSVVGQSVAATAGTIGISSALFGALPVAGFFLNVAIVPLCGLFMAEAFLFLGAAATGLAAAGEAAAGAVDASGLLVLGVNAWGASLAAPWALRATPPLVATAGGVAALLLASGLREGARGAAPSVARRGRTIAFALVLLAGALPLFPWNAIGSHAAVRPFLLAIDVGQGDALLARTRDGSALLFDAGPADEGRDAGRSAVEPALRAEGVTRVHDVVLSHAHGDHFGGLAWLARRGWIRALLENGSDPRGAWRGPIERGIARSGGLARRVVRDTTITLDGGRLDLRAPPPDSLIAASGNAAENDRSIVADLSMGATRVHVPGDAEERAEAAALGIQGRLSRADVLKAPHHGSRTSSTLEWLERIAPRIVLVSCGEGNRFRHPSPTTMGRYRRIGAKIFRTDQEGAIRVTPGRGGAWVSTRAHPAPEWIPFRDGHEGLVRVAPPSPRSR